MIEPAAPRELLFLPLLRHLAQMQRDAVGDRRGTAMATTSDAARPQCVRWGFVHACVVCQEAHAAIDTPGCAGRIDGAGRLLKAKGKGKGGK